MYHFNRPGVNALTQYLQQQQAPFAGMHQAMRNQPVNLGAMAPGMAPPDPSNNQLLWNNMQQQAALGPPGGGQIQPVPPGPPGRRLNSLPNPALRPITPPGLGGPMPPSASAPGGGGTVYGPTGQIGPPPVRQMPPRMPTSAPGGGGTAHGAIGRAFPQPARPGVDALRRALTGMGGVR